MRLVAREGWPFIAAAWGAAALLAALGWWPALAVWLPLAVWVVAFFRDPPRRPPGDDRLIVAPADGKIVGILQVDEPVFLRGRATRVSIFMNVFDVHVNRYPAAGVVRYRHYNPGRFLHAAGEKASLENEQSTVGLETPRGRLLVRQIAGLIARRIVTDHEVGAAVLQGGRLGLIRFGSRVDLFLPPNTRLLVRDGQTTRAGITVVAEWV
ncbi:MAG TPA: phosphatidylserine decarboxylase family protein [Gemmatimonadales bacterium]|nr:phosphatidylserine decarboxylase family protein [Gemmatimonadales bacterium]